MAVIALPSIQPQGSAVTDDWELRSITAMNRSPLNGVATTLERPGAHWAVTPRFHNLNGSNRARMQQHLANCRGHGSRMYVPLYGWTRRGSFAAPELLTNNTFANGTTGWTSAGPAISASDGLLRATRVVHDSTVDVANYGANPVTVTQYAPYAARCIYHQGRSVLWQSGPQIGSTSGGEEYGKTVDVAFGLKTLVSVLPASTAHFGLVDYDSGANIAGDYIEYSYTSLARCALVDNGPNFTQQSDTINNAYWSKQEASVSANAGTAPDGSSTADTLIENTANAQHVLFVAPTRTSQAEDWCIFGRFKRASGTRNIRLFIGRNGVNGSDTFFDLGTGAIAAGPNNAGDATNGRAFIAPLGDGWYYCAVVTRLTATTGLYLHFELASGITAGYTGDGTSGVRFWRCGAAQSGVPTRGMQTTSAGDSDGTLQTGSGLYLKGLPASTNGLLLQGDPVEIITNTSSQLVRVRSSLNSDAAGLGYLQFEAPLRISPLDNAAVIVCNPLCRMMLDDNTVRWSDHDGTFTDLEFTSVEDTSPT